MNIFDLRGPGFLLFYVGLSALVILLLIILRRLAEAGAAPKLDLSDPYLIAHLRGGDKATLRTAVIALVERGLLVFNNDLVERPAHVAPTATRHPLERAVLEKFAARSTASSVFADNDLKKLCWPYQQKLERLGLLPDETMRQARLTRFAVAFLILFGVGLTKAAIGLLRDRPIIFLVILMIVAGIASYKAAFPRLTARGKALLADLQTLYAGVKDKASPLSLNQAAGSALLLAAVFGMDALAYDLFGDARRHSSDGSSSSGGCGSSCSSSCGGGGCGGCGS